MIQGISAAANEYGWHLLLSCGFSATGNHPQQRGFWPVPGPEVNFVSVDLWDTNGLIVVPDELTKEHSHPPNWDNLAQLLTAGYKAVKACSPATRVMLHLTNGGDNGLYHRWFDNIMGRGVPFDVIGVSYYSYWHVSLADLQYNLNEITVRYDKDVIVVETAYPFTLADDDGWENIINLQSELTAGYPATPEGQAAMLRDVMSIVRAVPSGCGLGIFYRDVTWTGVPGNGWDPADSNSSNAWENQALFDFHDWPFPALNEFKP